MSAKPSKIWISAGGSIFPSSPTEPVEIKPGIYQIKFATPIGFHLDKISEKFALPEKIYDTDPKFINRVIRSFSSGTRNLGVLLNGIKGSGKTVSSKIICNTINLPVLLITENRPGLADFIHQIDFHCVILIDEYEKIFPHDERGALLSCMDGTQTSSAKILYLLTTNNVYVNENMLNRPSRIRYIKMFDDMPKSVILEILNDKLHDKKLIDECLSTVSSLSSITMDLLIEIINEVNLHGDPPKEFISIFNANRDTYGMQTPTEYNILDADDPSKIYYTNHKLRNKVSVFTGYGGMVYDMENYIPFLQPIKRYGESSLTCKLINPDYYNAVFLTNDDNDKSDNNAVFLTNDDNNESDNNETVNKKELPPQWITVNVTLVESKQTKNWQFNND